MSKEVKKESHLPAVETNKALAMAAHSNFVGGAANLELPRVLVVNDNIQEESIKSLKLDAGTIINTQTLEPMAKLGQPIRVVPLSMSTMWLLYEVRGTKKEFKGTEAWTGEKLEYETPIDKSTVLRRVLGMKLLFLAQSEIESGQAMPYTFTFKNSSSAAGKKLNTLMHVRNKMAGRAPWASMVDLYSVKRTKEGNTFATMDVKQVTDRGLNEAENQAAEFWVSQFMGASVTTSEDDSE